MEFHDKLLVTVLSKVVIVDVNRKMGPATTHLNKFSFNVGFHITQIFYDSVHIMPRGWGRLDTAVIA